MPEKSIRLQTIAPGGRILTKIAAAMGICIPMLSAYPANAVDLGSYRQIWADEFNGAAGSRPAPHWFFFDGWGSGKWRDAYYTTHDAYLDGSGNLFLRGRVKDGKFMTSYLQTYSWQAPRSQWTTFGPGAESTSKLGST